MPKRNLEIVVEGCEDGNKVRAIRTLREATGCGLKEAKDAVEQVGCVTFEVVNEKCLKNGALLFRYESRGEVEACLSKAAALLVESRRYIDAIKVLAVIEEVM